MKTNSKEPNTMNSLEHEFLDKIEKHKGINPLPEFHR